MDLFSSGERFFHFKPQNYFSMTSRTRSDCLVHWAIRQLPDHLLSMCTLGVVPRSHFVERARCVCFRHWVLGSHLGAHSATCVVSPGCCIDPACVVLFYFMTPRTWKSLQGYAHCEGKALALCRPSVMDKLRLFSPSIETWIVKVTMLRLPICLFCQKCTQHVAALLLPCFAG